ncbi:hypothetical protein HY857_02700 [Candidatus Saccharibacteria bacterium]|nr:hypothetical protein [Candidatus Saccharibacteria bacterium]
MRDSYTYRKTVHRHHYLAFRRRALMALSVLVIVGILAGVLFLDLSPAPQKPETSKVQTAQVSSDMSTFRSSYFQFRDSGKWVLKADESSANKYIYYKYKGLNVEHQLIVYVNQVPIPLYLATARVLPVRIVNNDSLDITTVSEPCVSHYVGSELHKIKTVSINQAQMLCDPDTPQYSVVLSQIDGNYQLNMTRTDGSPVKLVITYRDLRLNPGPDTLINIAKNFQAL